MKDKSKVEKETNVQFLCIDEKEKSNVITDDTGNDGGKPRPDPEVKDTGEVSEETETKD